MDYCTVPVPARFTETLGTQNAVLVMARVNESEPFKVSLFPVGAGQRYIRISTKVRAETKTKEDDRVRMRFTVLDRADVLTPKDLAAALRSESATRLFKKLPPGKQNFIIRRIDPAVKLENREKRIREAVEEARCVRPNKLRTTN